MLALVESFTNTYDSEAIQTRTELHNLTQSSSETRVLANCLEQKLHYLERELNWVTSALPRRPKFTSGTITEKSSEDFSSITTSKESQNASQIELLTKRMSEFERMLGQKKNGELVSVILKNDTKTLTQRI
jgi:hypothetical protein